MRKIELIIMHCSATPEGRNVTVDEVRIWHRQKGWSDIGYHYFIELDGTIRKGRPVGIAGAHARGKNSNSIGICYAGGCDSEMKPKDTRTQQQLISMRTLLVELKQKFPEATIHGHNEFSSKACPSFNVQEYLKLVGLEN